MNLLYIAVVLIIVCMAIFVPILMLAAYRKYRGKRILTCPETRKPVTVEIDARMAAATAVFGEPSLRLKGCSRWPERADCGQECLEQIRSSPEELLTDWYSGRMCAICGRLICSPRIEGHFPALMDSSGKTHAFEDFSPGKIPEALATHQAVCWNCHINRTRPTDRRPEPDEASSTQKSDVLVL